MAKAKRLFTIGYEQTPSKAVLDELEQPSAVHHFTAIELAKGLA